MTNLEEIGFVGCGQMGEALVRGLLQAGFCRPDAIVACDIRRERLDELKEQYGIQTTTRNTELVRRCRTVILAMKPQDMAPVLSELRPLVQKDYLIISIAAGIPVSYIEDQLPHGVRVVRVMPNTPCLLQMGCSALSAGRYATRDDMEKGMRIFKAVGEVVEVEEKVMDVVTGLSGNGPAYVYLFAEALIDAGVRMGLTRLVARKLVLNTLKGAAEMLQVTGRHPAELKEQVTSPGGTAMAALAELERGAFRYLLFRAVEAGTARSQELGKMLR
jgi:pyrroline-5-carboxylate reductase